MFWYHAVLKWPFYFFLFSSFFWPGGKKKLATGNFQCEKRSKIQSQWFCETNSKRITTNIQKYVRRSASAFKRRVVILRVGFIDLALRSWCACPSNSTSQQGRHSKSGDQLISPVTLLDSLTRPKLVGVLNEPHQGFPSRPPCLELLKEIITYFIDHSW